MFANLMEDGSVLYLNRVLEDASDSFSYDAILGEDIPSPRKLHADFINKQVTWKPAEKAVPYKPTLTVEELTKQLEEEKQRRLFLEDCIAEMATVVYGGV